MPPEDEMTSFKDFADKGLRGFYRSLFLYKYRTDGKSDTLIKPLFLAGFHPMNNLTQTFQVILEKSG
jgi:hypothetical protein